MRKPPNLSAASDHDLVAWAREGNEDAQSEIVRRYRSRVYDMIYGMVGIRELAEDLTQETFAKAFEALEQQDPDRKPSAWILRIANNTAIDYVRLKRPDSTRSHLTLTPGYLERRAMPTPTPRGTPTGNTDRRKLALKRALRRMKPKYRRCLVLRYLEHRSYAEIAQIMNLPVSTVGTNLQRAREELKGMLQPHPDDVGRR